MIVTKTQITTNDTHAPLGGVIAGSLNAGRANITDAILTEHSIGDKFFNPVTGNTNTVIHVKKDHYYSGSGTYGALYTLVVDKKDGSKDVIKGSSIMLKHLFTKI